MLNGIDPILIFNFTKLTKEAKDRIAKTPITADIISQFDLPAVPIYLSERLTGIYIDTEDKNVDVDTSIETLTLSEDPKLNQRGINNTVKITMLAAKDSIGLTLLSAMTDFVFPKVTSREYSITYLHGAITVFKGLLHSFAITQESGTTLYRITLELIRPGIVPKQPIPELNNTKGVQLVSGKVPGT
jgi:hypothetical protein